MSAAYVVAVEGLSGLDAIEALPQSIVTAARQAINKTTDRAKAGAARAMRQQVNFPARYLTGEDGQLKVTRYASNDDLRGVIAGRQRPTSLARFATGSLTPNRRNGVTVSVKPGTARYMTKAFLIRLRAGNADLDTQSNLGLAIRLKPGETIQNKREVVALGRGLYLLYGPSVDQVFRTVAEDIAPDAAAFLESEFTRLMEL